MTRTTVRAAAVVALATVGFTVGATSATRAEDQRVAAVRSESVERKVLVKVQDGSERVNRSGQTLSEIVESVQRVTTIIGEIAAGSREQSTGIDQVNRSMIEMDALVQGNAAQTEELSATARSLAERAAELQRRVARFTIEEETEREQPAESLPEPWELRSEPLRDLRVHHPRPLLRHPVA